MTIPDGRYWLSCEPVDDIPVTVIDGRILTTCVADEEIIQIGIVGEDVHPSRLSERDCKRPIQP